MTRHVLLVFVFLLFFISADAVYAFKVLKGIDVHGFVEGAVGIKLEDDTTTKDHINMSEQRLQLKTAYYPEQSFFSDLGAEFVIKADVWLDQYSESAHSWVRECNLFFSPFDTLDIKAGRQIFTWGTGSYLFINDLFPKDYVSFFIGRHDEYLKKPSDGIKASWYTDIVNYDLVVIPFFEPNTFPEGDRVSFFDAFQGGIAGRESNRRVLEPPQNLSNTETALRLYKNIGSYEYAAYFFKGFYKMPRGYENEALRQLYFPRVDVYGASMRGRMLKGIANLEAGFYNSREDRKGDNRRIENSSLKILAGYEQDMGNDLRVGWQYFYEQILTFNRYTAALLPGDYSWDEHRYLTTLHISQLIMNQTVLLSLFCFYSPTDEDAYIRPVVDYDFSDNLQYTFGANLIWRNKQHTEFGQMERNKNIYTRIRYSF